MRRFPQTRWGLGIEVSLFSVLELGLLTTAGVRVLAVVALPGSVALLLPSPLSRGLVRRYEAWQW